jgi:CRISPR/Cas system-associated exonuclease Cas4 (RecB family)
MLQAAAYGLILRREEETVILRVEYRRGSRRSMLDSEKVSWLLKVIDDIVLVKKYGIVPYAKRSPRRCAKCPFREVCEKLDNLLSPPEREELYEPGHYLGDMGVDESFKEK